MLGPAAPFRSELARGSSGGDVERRSTLTPEQLDREFLSCRRPVILTELFADAPVGVLSHRQVARAALADMPVPVIPNPVDRAVRGMDIPSPLPLTFAAFHDRLSAGAGRGTICAEHDLPDELAAYLPPVPHFDLGAADDPLVPMMFMSGRGNVTHLHFDRDLRHNLIYQVFGHKRYVIVDVAHTRKVALGAPPRARYASPLFLEHFSQADLDDFLRYTRAWDCTLAPGETLLIPATAWHYVEYVDVALSIHLRLPRNRYVMRLANLAAAADFCSIGLQALGAHLLEEAAVGQAEVDALAAMERVSRNRFRTTERRASHLARLITDECQRLGLPVDQPPYHLADVLDSPGRL